MTVTVVAEIVIQRDQAVLVRCAEAEPTIIRRLSQTPGIRDPLDLQYGVYVGFPIAQEQGPMSHSAFHP